MSTALKPIDEVRQVMSQMSGQFKLALPSHVTPEKFIRVLMTSIQNNPSLLEVQRPSLYSAAMKCAQDGLLPDGREAALVPYKGQVSYQPMLAGILKKIRNSGELVSISPHCVYSADQFEYWIDEQGEHLKHRPDLTSDERGTVTHVYCIAIIKGGGVYIEVMSRAQVEKVRAVSKAAQAGPWSQWWDEMARKTVLKRLAKRLPMSTDLDMDVLNNDEDDDLGTEPEQFTPPVIEKDVAAEPVKPNTSKRLAGIVQAAPTSAPTPKPEPAPDAPQPEPAPAVIAEDDLPV